MNPGDRVASPRSMIWAPCGIGRLLPASTILSPSMMTTPFVTSAFDFPAKRRAALRAMVAGSAAKAERITQENADSAETKRRKFFMASNMKFGRTKQGSEQRPTIDNIGRFRQTGVMRRACALSCALLLIARITSAADDFGALTKLADDFWT